MKLQKLLLPILAWLLYSPVHAQCITPPAFATTIGVEPLLINNDNLLPTQTKWFYGTGTIDGANLRGGTIIVSGTLQLDNFNFESGTLVVQAGANLLITNGVGLVLKGDCYIYNWGRFQITGNIVLDYGVTSATRPNIVVNATSSANFFMPNQYFVINNPWSRLVNNGNAYFGGIITDYNSVAGCVCMGDRSYIETRIVINNVQNTYVVPVGTSCMRVTTYSQFRNILTSSPSLAVCLAPGHTSDACCMPNAWGAAVVGTNCSSCLALSTTLAPEFFPVKTAMYDWYTKLEWQYSGALEPERFMVERSNDGLNFRPVAVVDANTNALRDEDIQDGTTYYRVAAIDRSAKKQWSTVIMVKRTIEAGAYPNPCSNVVFVKLGNTTHQRFVTVHDAAGRKVASHIAAQNSQLLRLETSKWTTGWYWVHVNSNSKVLRYRVFKN
jgi:hypothetical protein